MSENQDDCIVMFCRDKHCVLPENAEVNRTSGQCSCSVCNKEIRLHRDGKYWHT